MHRYWLLSLMSSCARTRDRGFGSRLGACQVPCVAACQLQAAWGMRQLAKAYQETSSRG